MRLKTPKFWQSNSIISSVLIPFSWVYYIGHLIKSFFQTPYKSIIPVVCIGGVVVGGSGKTPVLQAIVKLLQQDGTYKNPVILTRGYGGGLKGPTSVDVNIHTYKDVGDEALLHAILAPTIVSKCRRSGARLAEMMGADIILMDDGLQNNSLFKDISFLVIDSTQGLGNGRMIPAGPLRETYNAARSKCVAVIETSGRKIEGSLKTNLFISSIHDMEQTYFGFCGLGRPEKFQETLTSNGFTLGHFQSFPDHYPYTDDDIKMLLNKAGTQKLITTEKDFVRIPVSYQNQIDVLKIEIIFNKPETILGFLKP